MVPELTTQGQGPPSNTSIRDDQLNCVCVCVFFQAGHWWVVRSIPLYTALPYEISLQRYLHAIFPRVVGYAWPAPAGKLS